MRLADNRGSVSLMASTTESGKPAWGENVSDRGHERATRQR
jgi:hypothetical protein